MVPPWVDQGLHATGPPQALAPTPRVRHCASAVQGAWPIAVLICCCCNTVVPEPPEDDAAAEAAVTAAIDASEATPLFDRVLNEKGNPVPAVPIDRSYEAIVAIAEASRAAGSPKDAPTSSSKSVPGPAQASDKPANVAG